MKKQILISAIILIVSSCSDFKDSLVGTLGEKCFGNGTCRDGLICQDGLCVKDGEAGNDDDSGNTGDTGNTGNTGNTGDTGDTGNSGDDSDISNVETEIDDDVINDPCDPNPCTTVENSDNSCMPEDDEEYICGCKPGFLWNDIEEKCNAIPDPCLEDPCTTLTDSTCVPEKTEDDKNFTGMRECVCNEGFDKSFIGSEICVPAFKSVSTGKDHVCAIDYYDDLYCWGSNFNAQLGNGESGTGKEKKIPFKVKSVSTTWTKVSSGEAHTCGIDQGSDLYCWGYNYFGQLGNNESGEGKQEIEPVLVYASADGSFSTGRNHSCSIKSEDLYCWGQNSSGQLGSGNYDNINQPFNIASTINWEMISAGDSHTCGITTDNDLYCWGMNASGQIGDGTINMKNVPEHIGTEKWNYVSAGFDHTCGIQVGGTLFCWGGNSEGQLGDNETNNNSNIPVGVDSIMVTSWKMVSAGNMHTCGISSEDKLYCWGKNNYGQLGNGTIEPQNYPGELMGNGWADVSAGDGFTCAVKITGAMYCWGLNEFGQLGIGAITGYYSDMQAVSTKYDGN